ncbi:MAG TPA: PEP-CTERM sorting domain-containing protein [Lacipirellulaceae bacterium]|nr:PEP-CTERM sorting domain-containing protein [Lacipirellulaceae bacterium]
MAGRWNKRRISRHLVVGAAAAVVLIICAVPTQATVVIFDGFGDADLDNDGMALEMNDVDVSGDDEIEPYVPLEVMGNPGGSPAVFPAGTMVNEVSAVEDANDVGIKWFSIGQWDVDPPDPPERQPSIHIISDAAGALPDTNPSIGFHHAARNATSFAEAIDDGLALAVETKGRTHPAAGFFDEPIELGDAVDDEVRVSFDFRLWYSAPNFNANAMNHVPAIGEFRFGIYQDTDNQLGMPSQKAGPLATSNPGGVNDPRIWGADHGDFRGDNDLLDPAPVGANGDHGWFVRVPIDDPNTDSLNQLSSNIARINEETNEGTGNNSQIMNGTTDFVAGPADNPGTTEFPLRGIDLDNVYNFSLSLKRFDDPATEGNAGDAIFGQLTITERATGQQWSFGDYDSVGVMGGGDPDGGFESDVWDYFAMQTAGQSTTDDFDWIIDNFTVEVIGSNAGLAGDYNSDERVDAADYVIWRKGNINGQQGYDDWRANFGSSVGPGGGASLAAVPEPMTAVMLGIGTLLIISVRQRQRFI